MIITLERKDLREEAKDVSLAKMSWWHFNISQEIYRKATIIIFVDTDGYYKRLKDSDLIDLNSQISEIKCGQSSSQTVKVGEGCATNFINTDPNSSGYDSVKERTTSGTLKIDSITVTPNAIKYQNNFCSDVVLSALREVSVQEKLNDIITQLLSDIFSLKASKK